MNFKQICIIGLGLIGGSLAKSIRRRYSNCFILGIDTNQDNLDAAIAEGTINLGARHICPEIGQAEIIFICTPVSSIPSMLAQIAPLVSPNAIITDTGSTKREIVEAAQNILRRNVNFIGGHPMAGTQNSGYRASLPHLFENAYYVLTPLLETSDDALDSLTNLLESIGAIPLIMDAKLHDEIVCSISHLPHVVAAALVNTVCSVDDPNHFRERLAAGGFRDITRIASSDPAMWESISFSNRDELLKAIALMQEQLENFAQMLKSNNRQGVKDYFEKAQQYRSSLPDRQSLVLLSYHDLYVDVEDRPGIIGEVTSLLGRYNINIKNLRIINSREGEPGCLVLSLAEAISLDMAKKVLSQHGYKTYTKGG